MNMQPNSSTSNAQEPDENNPAFLAAVKFAKQALYESSAAKDVAKSLRASPDKVKGLSDTAYAIAGIVDERTNGAVPDELLVLLSITIMQEVADIGEAAGIDYSGADLGEAFKQMLLNYMGEQGYDVSSLQGAMNEVNKDVFNKINTEDAAA
jgi:hypothetical protein